MEKDIKDIDLQIEMRENRNEWRRKIHVDTIGYSILVHIANPNLLESRLMHCCCRVFDHTCYISEVAGDVCS